MINPPPISRSSSLSSEGRALRIDAHHHLWRYNEETFAWITEDMAPLRRDFLAKDLCHELQAANIDATVAVQARESLEETHLLLECARINPVIQGVVGWAAMEADDLSDVLDGFDNARKLVGFREIIQGKFEGYLDRPEFNRGIRQLTSRKMTYDILIYEQQLKEAIRFVDQHPYQTFVLDHAAKPKISSAELEPWRTNLRTLARRPNVSCKLSGLVTQANWNRWTLNSLRPYLDICVEAFGPHRLLAGSDWPVCLVASTYSQWWDVLARYFAGFHEEEIHSIFGKNAVDVYGLRGGNSSTDLV